MNWDAGGSDIFVRIDPGEQLVASLKRVADTLDLTAAAITSGVGMLDGIEVGFFNLSRDDYDRTRIDGIFDLSSIMGNIVRSDGEAVPHVHAVFNDRDYRTYSGHVIEAACHITIELFLSTTTLALRRVKLPGCPATRIIGGDASDKQTGF